MTMVILFLMCINHKFAQIKRKDVNSKSRDGNVYPPRIRLNIELTEQPRTPLSCDIHLSGIKDINSFVLRAIFCKETSGTTMEHNIRFPRLGC